MTKTPKNGRHAIGIAFSLIECRCGAMRVRAVACPDCGHGADWFEVDVENQRRGRVTALCVEALDRALATPHDITGDESAARHLDEFQVLAELPAAFLGAMQDLERPGPSNLVALEAACAAIGQVARRLADRPRLRPWIRTDNVAQTSANAVVDMARKFLAAFSAPTPLLAQRHADTAQKSLDDVSTHVAELNLLRDRWEGIEAADDVGDWMAEALVDAGKVRGTTGFVDLDAAGRDLYSSITGRTPGEGAGLGLLVTDVFSQYVGDEDAFHQAIAAADQFLHNHGDEFRDALARQTVADELRNGLLLMADQVHLTNAAIAASLNDRQAVRSALDLMHTVFEGPGRRMVALLLDLDGTVRFEESLPADGAATIKKARDRTDIGAVTYGFDAALRIAEAHQNYELQDDCVVLRMRKKGSPEGQIVRVSLDDLLDRVLASLECLNAIALVVQVHASENGIDLIGADTLVALGVGPVQFGAALLRTSGYCNVAFDEAAQTRAAEEVIGWVAQHATTRVGPRGRQVQVPVEKIEAAVVRHYTSRAGDPHRHLHVQINARVHAAGAWRGLHSVGVVDSIEALNGIGHAAVMCDPQFRTALAEHGYTLNDSGEVEQLAPYAGRFSQRTAQINRNVDRYETEWRTEHPGEEPGPKLRQSWDRRAWADARPDKVVPADGADLVARWNGELHDLGFRPPVEPVEVRSTAIGRLRRDAAVDLALTRLGAKRSAWNAADIRGEVEKLIPAVGIIADRMARTELAEDLTARAVELCRPLRERGDVPEHIRNLTSDRVLDVEAKLIDAITTRALQPVQPSLPMRGWEHLDAAQRDVVAALAGDAGLLVIEGAAGTGKTTTLAAARDALDAEYRRLVVVTPTLKAAQAARQQVGADAFSAAWLIHQNGFRWDADGHWSRINLAREQINSAARLSPGDVLLIDEAGMLDQDTARALFAIADRACATVALLGDRHQLPAVGRGGVLDLAARWVTPAAHLELESVHRFVDPEYANLSLLMREGDHPADVFDALLERGLITIHPSDVERTAALAEIGAAVDDLIIADTREQVSALNAAIRDHRQPRGERTGEPTGERNGEPITRSGERNGEPITRRGERIGLGDRVATRRNDRDLGVANRDVWTVAGTGNDGSLLVTGSAGQRRLPREYVDRHVELAFASTVYGAQGETVDSAHLVIGETTGAAAAYVAMTRGRHSNVAHLVADSVEDAREQWVGVFSRDRADLGPGHAATRVDEDIERYGTQAHRPSTILQAAALKRGLADELAGRRPRPEERQYMSPRPAGPGIGR